MTRSQLLPTWRWAGVLALSAGLALTACSKEDQAAVTEKASEAAESAAEAGQKAVDAAGEAVSSGAEAAREAAGNAVEKASEMASDAADKASDMADKAGDAASNAVESASEAASNAASAVADKAGEMKDAASNAASDAGNAASEAATDAGEAASDAGEAAADKASDAASATREAAGNAVDAARETAGDAVEGAKSMGSDAKDAATDAAEEARKKAADAVEKAREKAAETVDKQSDAGAAVGGAVAAATAAGAAVAAGQPDDASIRAAWVYVGPVGDGGWSFAHDNARKAVQAAMGSRMTSTYVESVPETADAERVLRDLAAQGNKIIFGTTFGYMEPMRKLSREFPDVRWEHATGYKTAANMRTYDSRTYQGAYMAGVLAGGMTQSNTLGVVGSIPIPEVIRNINSFTLGARSVNPDITTRVVWVNKWFDPPREAEAAQALIDQGADVLFQNTDSSAVLQTAEKSGKYGIGWDSDMTAYGPRAHLASAVINWVPYYTRAVEQALDGTWETGSAWWGVAENAIDLVSISDKVPADLRATVESVKASLRDSSFRVWTGPIADNTGKQVVAADTTADDDFLRGINFFVEGVEGRVPSGS